MPVNGTTESDSTNSLERSRNNDRAKPRRNWGRRLIYGLILLAVVVFLLPIVVAKTSVLQRVVDMAAKDVQGRVVVKSASLNWFSPIVLQGVEIQDEAGQTVATVARFESKRPLLSFLYSDQLGQFDLVQPHLELVLDTDKTNLERVLEKYLRSEEDSSGELPIFSLQVSEGTANFRVEGEDQVWELRNIGSSVETRTGKILAESKCEFHHLGKSFGGLSLVANLSATENEELDLVTAALNARNFPVAILEPVLDRLVGPTQVYGYMSGEVSATQSLRSGELSLHLSQVSVDDTTFRSPDLIGADVLQWKQVTADGKLQLAEARIGADSFELKSDFGTARIEGKFDLHELTQAVAHQELPQSPFRVSGRIDVPELSRTLRHTLGFHQDLEMQSGEIQFEASLKQQSGGAKLVFNADSANLTALRQGQAYRWHQPLRLSGSVSSAGSGLQVDALSCESEFLTASGNGKLEAGSCQFRGDLAKLTERLSQFVDLQGWQARGMLDGQFNWKYQSETPSSGLPIELAGFVSLDQFSVLGGDTPWEPGRLASQWRLLANAGESGALGLQSFELVTKLGNDELRLQLLEPIQDYWTAKRWQCKVNVQGQANSLAAFVNQFVPVGEIRVEGGAALEGIATLDASQLRLNQIRYSVKPFVFDGYTMTLRESQLSGNANVHYDWKTGGAEILNASANGQSARLKTRDFHVQVNDSLGMKGRIEFAGRLDQMANYWQLSPTPDSVFYLGDVSGTVDLATTPQGAIDLVADARVQKFSAAYRVPVPPQPGFQPASNRMQWQPMWEEEDVQVKSTARLSASYEELEFQQLDVVASTAVAKLTGQIRDLLGVVDFDLQGEWNPNWNVANQIVEEMAGPVAAFAGTHAKPIQIQGPFFVSSESGPRDPWLPAGLKVTTSVQWDQANLLQLPVNQNEIQIGMNQSVVQFNLQQLGLANGFVNVSPELHLYGDAPSLRVKQSATLKDLVITPEMCEKYLKFVAPLAADVTSAQGQFSVTTHQIAVPINHPEQLTVQGAIQFQQVTVGAGPLAQQVLSAVQQVQALLEPEAASRDNSTWLRLNQQQVPVVVQQGRVYHRDLALQYRDINIVTRGSVGFDQTINIIAEIPVLDRWVVGKKWFEGLRGKSISVPISGKLTNPQVDRRALTELSKEIARATAGSVLNQAIEDKTGINPNQLQGGLQNKLNQEANRFQEKIQGKLEGELQKGLDSLFKKRQ